MKCTVSSKETPLKSIYKNFPELEKLRGMSEPFAFTFNLEGLKKGMLVHAVIFTSYEAGEDAVVKLAEPTDDPRFGPFIRYIVENLIEAQREQLKEMDAQLEKHKRELLALEVELKKQRERIKHG